MRSEYVVSSCTGDHASVVRVAVAGPRSGDADSAVLAVEAVRRLARIAARVSTMVVLEDTTATSLARLRPAAELLTDQWLPDRTDEGPDALGRSGGDELLVTASTDQDRPWAEAAIIRGGTLEWTSSFEWSDTHDNEAAARILRSNGITGAVAAGASLTASATLESAGVRSEPTPDGMSAGVGWVIARGSGSSILLSHHDVFWFGCCKKGRGTALQHSERKPFEPLASPPSICTVPTEAWLAREEERLLGLVAGRCVSCGGIEYPRPVTRCPSCGGEVREAILEPAGAVLISTVDYLYDSRRPTGMAVVDLDGGGRFYGQIADETPPDVLSPGTRVRLVPRVLYRSPRGSATYFWKVSAWI